ncbi:peptidase S41 [Shinella zoogloeoides]|uniref:peptidase S41 n=1 Tax=Shinella zoogloeoides TaxID=352475 RepID=UPI00273E24F4|nr:peptidase S41 [Shinella zoogloeoides]WLR95346.1 peptidase S41 [Shinella zoogloeoides]
MTTLFQRLPVVVMLAAAICLSSLARADEIQLTPKQMREDLAVLRSKWAPLDKSLTVDHRRAFETHVAKIESGVETLTPKAFAMEVMRAVAIAGNGHTSANIGPYLGRDLPIRAWWFADGLYVVKAHPDFARLIGARIDRLGSLSASQAQARLEPYLAGTDQRTRFLGPGYLVTPRILEHIGAVDGTASIPLTLLLRNGTTETLHLATSEDDPCDERKTGLNRGYSVLIPDPSDTAGRWPHVLDGAPDISKGYLKRSDVAAAFLDDTKTILYIRNDTVDNVGDTLLVEKFGSIIQNMILPSRPKHVLVDLRLNNGGDFFNSILFTQALPRLLPRDGRIFVLVSRATFSAGIVTAAMLKGNGRERVTFIGEPMGDGGQFWAEGGKITLPHSKVVVRYSTEFEDYETGCTDFRLCYWATVAFGPRGISISPDIMIDLTFAEYAEGRDPVLEKAVELAKQEY